MKFITGTKNPMCIGTEFMETGPCMEIESRRQARGRFLLDSGMEAR